MTTGLESGRPDSQAETWHARLDRLIERSGWTHAELERRSGVSRKRIGEYRAGKSEPSAIVMARIARALGTSVESLAIGTDQEVPSIAAAGRQALAEIGGGPASAAQQPSAYDRALDAIATAEARSGFIPPQGLRIALASILIHHHISLDELTLLFQALRQE